jgi:peptidoglycan-N-acetylglucosamine deacetylase
MGHVTIDASDWYYDQRLRERLTAEPGFDVTRYREPYLKHLWDRATYYDGLSRKVLGRSVPHTILVHYNLINSLFLGDALTMFQTQGWNLVAAKQAYKDAIFTRQPQIAPAGESLLWALAKETGTFDFMLRYPGEDDVYEKPILDRLGL